MRENMWHLAFLSLVYLTQCDDLQLYSLSCKWHTIIFLWGWIIFHVYIYIHIDKHHIFFILSLVVNFISVNFTVWLLWTKLQ
jgi:hypothetical protein